MLKLKESYDGIDQVKVDKNGLMKRYNNSYIIQPFFKFNSEVQFYFIKNQFQYALEFTPSKVPIYPIAKKYLYSKDELNLAQTFANLREN